MLSQSEAVDFLGMGKRNAPSRQVNVRLPAAVYDEAEQFRLAEPYEPTWGILLRRLVTEWTERKRAEAADGRGSGGGGARRKS